MSGLVYCRWCDHSASPPGIALHEPSCSKNPAYVEELEMPPREPGHVARDHFLRQFDRYPEGEQRLRAMAAHAAMLYNSLQDEKRLRLATLRDIVQRLGDASPMTALALSLDEAAREMEDD